MQKINFQNLPNTTTPVNATYLNDLQDNIEDVFNGNEAMGDIIVGDITVQDKVQLGTGGICDYNAAGFEHDQYGNWKHKRNTISDIWSIQDSNGTNKFTVKPETGDVNTQGYISNPILNNYYGLSYDNVDANDFTENGVYYLRINCTNVPTSYFYLIVVRACYYGASDMIQFGFDANCTMYARFRNGNAWGSWVYFSHN